MAKLHEIGIGADTRAFEDKVRSGIIKPTEDAEGAMERLGEAVGSAGNATDRSAGQVTSFADKLADAARKAGKTDDEIRDALKSMGVSADDARRAVDRLGDDFKDTGRDGERSVGDLEEALKDAQRQTRDLGDSVDDTGDKARRGMARAEEGVKGFKDEAMQSARETAASFDGSFESIADLGQEVAANAFADFGPAGAAAGLAVAAAAGVMVNHFNEVQEAADEARESAFSLAYDVAGALESAGYTNRISEWTNDTEKFKQVTDLANISGWEQVDVVDALASGGPKLDELTRAFAENGMTTSETSGRVRELEAALQATRDGYLSGADAATLAERANFNYAMSSGVATGEVDALGNAIYRLPDETEVAVNAKTQQATEDIQRVEDKAGNIAPGTVSVHADTSAAERSINALTTKRRTIRVDVVRGGVAAGLEGWDK